MSTMKKNDYLICLEDTVPYIRREQFVAAMDTKVFEDIELLLSTPMKDLTVDTLKKVWSRVKTIL